MNTINILLNVIANIIFKYINLTLIILIRFRRTFEQLIEADQFNNRDPPNYISIEAPPSELPRRIFCAVCGFRSSYTCTTCGARYCCISCLDTHQATRCLKWAV